MLLAFKALWDKIGVYVVLIGTALASLFVYGQNKKRQGASELRDKVNKESENVQRKWDEIDRHNPSVDDALDRLSRNSKD